MIDSPQKILVVDSARHEARGITREQVELAVLPPAAFQAQIASVGPILVGKHEPVLPRIDPLRHRRSIHHLRRHRHAGPGH